MKRLLSVLLSILCLATVVQFAAAEPSVSAAYNGDGDVTEWTCPHNEFQVIGEIETGVYYVTAAEHETQKRQYAICTSCLEFKLPVILERSNPEFHTWMKDGEECIDSIHYYYARCTGCGERVARSEWCDGNHESDDGWQLLTPEDGE